jgi:hypothetical protein
MPSCSINPERLDLRSGNRVLLLRDSMLIWCLEKVHWAALEARCRKSAVAVGESVHDKAWPGGALGAWHLGHRFRIHSPRSLAGTGPINNYRAGV